MKNIVSLLCMLFLAVCVSSCGSKYARPDRCVCDEPVVAQEPAPAPEPVAEPAPEPEPEPVVEPTPEPEPEPATEQEKAVKEAIQEAVQEAKTNENGKKEFTLNFEQLSKQSLFKTGSSEISDDNYASLDIVAKFMKENENVEVTVEGHTDSTGSKDFNDKLSKKRAQAVADYLISKGVDSSRVSTIGYGSSKPIASNKTAEGRAKNRRTEMKFSIAETK